MKKRPVCMMCLLFVCVILLTDGLGIFPFRENPLPESVQAWIRTDPLSLVYGEVESSSFTETSQTVCLNNAYLIFISENISQEQIVQSEQLSQLKQNVQLKQISQKISIDRIQVYLKEKKELPAGSFVCVSGNLEEFSGARNPGAFDARSYYAVRHMYYYLKEATVLKIEKSEWLLKQFLERLRTALSRNLEEAAGSDAGVFQAMLLGEKEHLQKEVQTMYQMAGIVHILAISGLHISILGMGFYRLLLKLGIPLKGAGICSLAGILFYGIMIGGSVSSMRAFSMFFLLMTAKITGKTYDLLTGLSLAAILLLLESPAYLYDSGFLLSFGAVLGIGAVKPRLLENLQVKGKIKILLLSSAAVQLITLPVVLYTYGEVSLAGVFLNLLVLPTVGVVLTSGAAAGVLGIFSAGAAAAAIVPGRCLLMCYEILCESVSKLSFCTWITGRPEVWQCATYYVILFFILAAGKWLFCEHREKRCVCIRFLTFAGILLAAGILAYQKRGELKICCLDVGQGDGIVISAPEGAHFLVDGGSSSQSGVGRYQLIPYLKCQGISCLDGIILSHMDEDHISGVKELLEDMGRNQTNIRAENLYLPDLREESPDEIELKELARKAGISVKKVNAGDVLRVGGVEFRFLHPKAQADASDVNESSLIFVLEYGTFQGLFMGDAGEKTEKALLEELQDVDFLKVGHHGSAYSSCEEFLAVIRPQIGVISCSQFNTYGHPAKEAIERLEKVGCQVEYTMKSGAVSILTDGKKMRLERFVPS